MVYCGNDNTAAVANMISALEQPPSAAHAKKKFILISGCLIYQPSPMPVDEEAPLNTNLGRYKTEQVVLSSPLVHGVVTRPTFVYGKSMSYMGAWFDQFHKEGKVTAKGNPDKIHNYVHISDLADGITRIAEASDAVVTKQVFNFGDSSAYTHLTVATALARAAGYKGPVDVVPNQNKVDEYFDRYARVDSSKARRLLGWVPIHAGLLEEAELYYNSWKIHNELNPTKPSH